MERPGHCSRQEALLRFNLISNLSCLVTFSLIFLPRSTVLCSGCPKEGSRENTAVRSAAQAAAISLSRRLNNTNYFALGRSKVVLFLYTGGGSRCRTRHTTSPGLTSQFCKCPKVLPSFGQGRACHCSGPAPELVAGSDLPPPPSQASTKFTPRFTIHLLPA